MKKIVMILTLACLLGAFTACGGGRKPSEPLPANYFTGEFVYFADAAVFFDCATGARHPVAMEGDFIAAQRGYMDMSPEMGERVWISFNGHIEYRLSAEESQGKIPTIIIDSFIRFDRSEKCNAEFTVTGMYQSEGSGIRRLLRLRPDYTFEEIRYADDGSERSLEGTWGSVSREEIALDYADPQIGQMLFQVVAAKESLIANNGREPLVYKKVYVN